MEETQREQQEKEPENFLKIIQNRNRKHKQKRIQQAIKSQWIKKSPFKCY